MNKMRLAVDIDQTILYTDSNYSILGFNKKLIELLNVNKARTHNNVYEK